MDKRTKILTRDKGIRRIKKVASLSQCKKGSPCRNVVIVCTETVKNSGHPINIRNENFFGNFMHCFIIIKDH